MARLEWEGLPLTVRRAVSAHTGTVSGAHSPPAGRGSDLATTLHTATGLLFCKGIRVDEPTTWTHRAEAALNPHLPDVVPRLLWTVEVAGWLLLGFEHIAGRHADLGPDSPDLPMVADAVTVLQRENRAAREVSLRRFADRLTTIAPWTRLRDDPPLDLPTWQRERLDEFVDAQAAAARATDGESVIHADLHPLNILVADKARVVDWAWASRAARWVDLELLGIRLVVAGHTPAAARAWLTEKFSAPVDPGIRWAFAITMCGLWEYRSRSAPAGHWPFLVAAARAWARHHDPSARSTVDG
ncbi:hypothetical protein GCM10022247_64580 [Allokutzneria multivorans]|uniref:Aminoglycoside phosphotransferase domain-containing protein n=1 Tax=Allokutzneria multivorans TaxID=1142134 RepID=A0ABP7TSF4_9PSEU